MERKEIEEENLKEKKETKSRERVWARAKIER